MRMRNGLVLAVTLLFLVAAPWLPRAQASQMCHCDDGSVVQTRDNDDDACEEACAKASDESGGSGDQSAGDEGDAPVRRRADGSPAGSQAPDPRIP
jgi:hypothetical protein